MVSNISIMQKVMTKVTMVNTPMSKNPSKLNLKKVVSIMSAKGGRKEAVFRVPKGSTFSTAKEPAQ